VTGDRGLTRDTAGGASIYRQILRERFETLAPELRAFHDVRGAARFRGQCRIEGAPGIAGRLLARLAGMPGSTPGADFEFELLASDERESWIRRFPGRAMRSTMHAAEGELVERFGPVSFWFSLIAADGRLEMVLARVKILGVPLPRALMPQVWGREKASKGMLHFDAGARLPLLGPLVAYSGFLIVASTEPARPDVGTSPCASS
jgi:hypothetical protein